MVNRRQFLGMVAARLGGQTAKPQWPSQVLDTHLHLRGNPDSKFEHIEDGGVTRDMLAIMQRSAGF